MNFSKLSESMLLVWAAAAVGLAAAARVAEVQLAGCNTDCGRVEVRYDAGGEWHGLAANDWTLRDAEGICAALGRGLQLANARAAPPLSGPAAAARRGTRAR